MLEYPQSQFKNQIKEEVVDDTWNEEPEGIVNAPRELPLVNDPDGYILLSDKYLWIKFSDETEKLEYRINGLELIHKFREFRELIRPCRGVKFLPNEVWLGGVRMLVIELHRPGKDNFRALVNYENFRQVLYDFDVVKVVGY